MSGINFDFDLEDGELFSMNEDFAEGLIFRSMDVARPTQVAFHAPQAVKNFSGPVMQELQRPKSFVFSPSTSCPHTPRCLPVSKFTVVGELPCLVNKISDYLQAQEDFDVVFIDDEFMWRGKYSRGPSCFEVAINLYNDAPNAYTVAVRKLKNDCAPNGEFCVFYTAFRSAIAGGCGSSPRIQSSKSHGALPFACGSSSGAGGLTTEEFLEGIRPVFCMAGSPCQENRVQAAKMLCDISSKESRYLELPAFKSECVRTLAALVNDEDDEVCQYAVVAIAAFAELSSYQESFIASCIVPALFRLVESSPADPSTSYETAQVRRTAAAVLATLCKSHPYSVRACVRQGNGQLSGDVSNWLARAPVLEDARTREAALAVKSALEDVSVENRVIDHTSFSDEFLGLECGFVDI